MDKKHNLLHWMAVIMLRLFWFLLFTLVFTYTLAFGFILSAVILQTFFKANFFNLTSNTFENLPFYLEMKKYTLNLLYPWYKNAQLWLAMAIGIPIVLVSLSGIGIVFFNLLEALVSGQYNRTHCLFCKNNRITYRS